MGMDFDIVYQFQTSLEAHLLSRPFKGFSHEGLLEEPSVVCGSSNVIIFSKLSFFFAGRPVNGFPDPQATERLFYVSLNKEVALNVSVSSAEDPLVAVAFCYDFTRDNDSASLDLVNFKAISRSELETWNNKGLILGRLYSKPSPSGGLLWYYSSDCAVFADRYYVDHDLTGYRVAVRPIATSLFDPNAFCIMSQNVEVKSLLTSLQRYPDGTLVPVRLSCSPLDLSVIPVDDVGSHPREGWYYAVGFRTVVKDDQDLKTELVGGEAVSKYVLDFSVLGYGSSLDLAIEACIDSNTGFSCPPMAVVKWSSSQSEITQFNLLSPMSITHTIGIDPEASFEVDSEDGLYKGERVSLVGSCTLPVPVRVDPESASEIIPSGFQSLHFVLNQALSLIKQKVDYSDRGIPGGVATLGADGLVLQRKKNNIALFSPVNFYSNASSSEGIRVTLPYKPQDNIMICFTVRFYANYEAFDIQFSGYLSSTNWLSPKSELIVGVSNKRVVMGIDENGYGYVWIQGNSNYCGCAVFDVVAGYNVTDCDTGWNISRTNATPSMALDKTLVSNNSQLSTFQQTLINIIYPIGVIYESTNGTNPGILFPGTTWTDWGAGRVSVGHGDSSFGSAGTKGGESRVTLSSYEIPSHHHYMDDHIHKENFRIAAPSQATNQNPMRTVIQTSTSAQNKISLTSFHTTQAANNLEFLPNPEGYPSQIINPANDAMWTSPPVCWQANTGFTGGGLSHENRMPYEVVYKWKRTG